MPAEDVAKRGQEALSGGGNRGPPEPKLPPGDAGINPPTRRGAPAGAPRGSSPVPGPGGYSYRSASMVLRPAARLAGQSPKKRPTPTENPNATATATGET